MTPWNKGLKGYRNAGSFKPGSSTRVGTKHSEETKAKMSEAWKHRAPMSDETRQKLSLANKGRKLSDEQRAKLSLAHKGKPNGHLGCKMSEEIKQKISAANKGKRHPHSEATKARMRGRPAWNKGLVGPANPSFNPNRVTPLKKLLRAHTLYIQWRMDILLRDDYTCQICGKRGGKLNVDHHPKAFIRIVEDNRLVTVEDAIGCAELWDTSNGRTLCLSCHRATPTWGNPWKEVV